MRLWIDCEWNGYRGELISLAMAAEDGTHWYGVLPLNMWMIDPWVSENVIPVLNQDSQSANHLRVSLALYLASFQSVEIIADWPEDIEHFCRFLITGPGTRIGPDVMTFRVDRYLPDTSTNSRVPHNALEDAMALRAGAMEAER